MDELSATGENMHHFCHLNCIRAARNVSYLQRDCISLGDGHLVGDDGGGESSWTNVENGNTSQSETDSVIKPECYL